MGCALIIRSDGAGVGWFLNLGVMLLAGSLASYRPVLAARKTTAEKAIATLRECPGSLREGPHERFMEGLDLVTAEHLDQVLAVVRGSGPVSCRGLAIVVAGGIAAKDHNVVNKVIQSVTPYLSHSVLWQAVIQAIVPIGVAANDDLMQLLDTQDEATWKGVIVILQNINSSRLPKNSELISGELPATSEGRAQVSTSWRRWWQNAER